MTNSLATAAKTETLAEAKTYPVSFAQERLWFLDQMQPGNPAFNMHFPVPLKFPVNVPALERALNEIVRRHEALRTVFSTVDEQPVQVVQPELHVDLPLIDIQKLPPTERAAEVRRLSTEDHFRPFDLQAGPLIRASLLRLGPTDYVLLLSMHHSVSDGWSMGVFFKELTAIYTAFGTNQPSPLPPLRLQYGGYSQIQRKRLQGKELARQLDYWKKSLGGAPVLQLPTDRPRPPVQTSNGGDHTFRFSPQMTQRIKQLSQRERVTPFMLQLAAFDVLLSRYSGQEDIVVGTYISNRNGKEIEKLIGFFVNTLVLRTDLSGDPTFRELLQRVREVALGGYAHQEIPFPTLVAELEVPQDLSRNPIFQVVFQLNNTDAFRNQQKGGEPPADEEPPSEGAGAAFDIVVHMWEPDVFRGRIEFNADLFEHDTVARMARHFEMILQQAVERPDQRLSEFSLITEAERRSQRLSAARTKRPLPSSQSVTSMFEAAAARHAGETAFFAGRGDAREELTYAELSARANRVARLLLARGVRPEQLVGVCLERSLELPPAMLGVWKAGAAYLPIDPGYPRDRVRFMLEDAKAPVVVTLRRHARALQLDGVELLCLDDDPELGAQSGADPGVALPPDQLAYAIYTSGSTGQPKGVAVEHRQVLNRLAWMWREYPFGPGEVGCQKTAISFVDSLWELLGPLLKGVPTLMLPGEVVRDPGALVRELAEARVSRLWLVPSLLKALLDSYPDLGADLPDLKFWVASGEALPPGVVAQFRRAMPGAKLYNLYGTSEIWDATWYDTSAMDGRAARVPIGTPIDNVRTYVLDKAGRPVPAGVPGELCVAGVGLCRGYLHREELTASRLAGAPAVDERVAYRTGDLVRCLPDGNLEYLGRVDHQVKVRGVRVELGEIEAVMAQHPGVREAVVTAHEDAQGESRLVGYLVPRLESTPAGAGAGAAVEAGDVEDHVRQWGSIYDEVYRGAAEVEDAALNHAGWVSSYTGEPFSSDEVRELIDDAAARVCEGAHRRVLEVGAGTGMILFRVAPDCELYWATEISEEALAYLREHLAAGGLGERVRLVSGGADDLSAVADRHFDVVVYNTVVQYFPSVDYLLRSLEQAVALTAPGGRVFVGDVRHLGLVEPFHTSVEVGKAPADITAGELRERVGKTLVQEKELAIDPGFFTALAAKFPRVSHVEFQCKRGEHHNEFTNFRYDVTLHVEGKLAGSAPEAWLDWGAEGLSADSLRQRLADNTADVLAVGSVPNLRLAPARRAQAVLAAAEPGESAEQLRAKLGQAEPGEMAGAIDPEQLYAIGEELGYQVRVGWESAQATDPARLDALFVRRPADGSKPEPARLFAQLPTTVQRWGRYTNQPLQATAGLQLVPRLRKFLAGRLPEAMLPSSFVVLDSVPLGPTGKVDRGSLPSPDSVRPELQAKYLAPRTPLEEKLAAVWADVLGLKRVGVEDNFFTELGGHSLLATQVVSRLPKQLGVSVELMKFFENPTVAEFAKVVGKDFESGALDLIKPLDRSKRRGGSGIARGAQSDSSAESPAKTKTYPVSFAQERLWFLDQLQPGNPAFNMHFPVPLKFPVNVPALERALNEIVRRHEALRTVFSTVDEQPVQVVQPELHVDLPLIDIQKLPPTERAAEVRRLSTEDHFKPFDLQAGPLIRASLVRLATTDNVLLLSMHHSVSDGWSMGVFFKELTAIYTAFSLDRPSPLQPLPLQYGEYAAWQRERLQGEELARQLDYWKKSLGGAPVLQLPTDRPRPPVQTSNGGDHTFRFSTQLTQRIRQLCKDEGVTPFMLQLAAFDVLLSRYSGQEDIVVGTYISNRNGKEIEKLIGFFVNTLVLRTDLSGDPTFRELLQRVREVALGGYAHQEIPFPTLVAELEVPQDLSRNPIFQVVFQLNNTDAFRNQQKGGEPPADEEPPSEGAGAAFDIVVHMWEPDVFRGRIEFNADLFEHDTVARMARHFEMILQQAVERPDQRLSEFSLITEAERRSQRLSAARTKRPLPSSQSVTSMFEAAAARHAGETAFFAGRGDAREELTYAELSARANRVARLLLARGVRPEQLVGVCLERSLELPPAMLGVWKAGAAYLPIDPGYPRDRVRFMLEDAKAPVVVTLRRHARALQLDGVELLCLDDDPELGAQSGADPGVALPPDQLAYAIYTSGSTGQPKGVAVEHRQVLNRLAWMWREYPFGPGEVGCQKTAISFVDSLWELLGPLLKGVPTLMLPGEVVRDPGALVRELAEARVSRLWLVPSLLKALLDSYPDLGADLPDLKFWVASGEALPPGVVAQFRRAMPGAKLYNLYGTSEIWDATWYDTSAMDGRAARVPIGTPIDNVRTYVLDKAGRPVPAGVPGELCVAGVGLCRGYLHREELTASRLAGAPAVDERVAYRTGDLVRCLPDGNLEYLGRVDHQVKVRGVRVELGEIEAVMAQHPGVREAVVTAHEDAQGESRLVGYLVPRLESTPAGAGAGAAVEAGDVEDHVRQWGSIYDEVYRGAAEVEDAALNHAGWVSSYTGEPFSSDEVRELIDDAAARVCEGAHRRVLEVGAGTGMILFRVAPDCELYWATEISEEALAYLREHLAAGGLGERVRLVSGGADDLSAVADRHFDVVVYNTVVQYFPSVDYLLRSLEQAVALTAPGGRVFVGDVRHLGLVEPFHTSVEVGKAPADITAGELRERVGKTLVQEKELAIDPGFFTALAAKFPRVSHVEFQCKRGEHHNEFTNFRYDVTLHVEGKLAGSAPEAWLDWGAEGLSADSLRQRLADNTADVLAVGSVPNLRLAPARRAQAVLAAAEPGESAEQLRAKLGQAEPGEMAGAIDPEQLYAIGEELGYQVRVGWESAQATDPARLDALFVRRPADGSKPEPARLFAQLPTTVQRWGRYTNQPLQATAGLQLVPRLRKFLAGRLPEAMLPSSFVVLDSVPLGPTGKVDRGSLPSPDSVRPELQAKYLAPRTPLEEKLAAVWADVLGLKRVGVEDNFFTELGGHSLLATQVVSRLPKQLGVSVELMKFFENPTVAEFAKVVEAAGGATIGSTTPIAEPSITRLSRDKYRVAKKQ